MRCEYFALCTNEAAGTVTHPILGEVPTCERCAAKFDLTINPFKEGVKAIDSLVAQVKAYAMEHYDEGGWDVIVECFTDAEIAEQIKGTRTLKGALKRFDVQIDVWSDRQADARNSAF